MNDPLAQILTWPGRRWAVTLVGAVATAVVIGIPTVMVANPWFTRMTPTVWWEFPLWLVPSVLAGLIVATFVPTGALRTPSTSTSLGSAASGGVLSALAIGCPDCNKAVVSLVGVSRALTIWAPLQPIVGAMSIGLLAVALRRRLDDERSCRLPEAVGPAG